MTLTHRRIIYLSFMAIFFMVLPLIILYANGYKYNFKKDNLQKSGIIFLETKPKDVEVFLNNNKIDDKIPVLIKNLTPNEYNLKVIKEGYGDWIKKVNVNEGQTTFLQYVRLFKNNETADNLYQGKINNFKYNVDENILVLHEIIQGKHRLTWFDADNQEKKEIIVTTENIKDFELVENGKLIFVTTDEHAWLINPAAQVSFDLNKIIGITQPINLKVNNYNGDYIYFVDKDGLYNYNLINNKKELLLPYAPIDYLIENNTLYYLNQNSLNNIFLNEFNLANKTTKENILSLELADDYQILNVKNNFFTIKNKATNKLTVFDKQTNKITKFDGAEYVNWNNQYEELIYNNTNELWVFKPLAERDKQLLLNRTSESLGEAQWYPLTTHVIYHTNNVIKIIENLATNRNITDIFQADEILQLVINKKGDKIYFIGQVDGVDGLFELEIE